MKRSISFLMVVLLIMFIATTAYADSNLAWNASTGDVVGYTIYCGKVSGVFTLMHTIGNVTSLPNFEGVFGLHINTTYFITVRAFNLEGESGNSNILEHITSGYTPPANVYETPESPVPPMDPANLGSE